MDNTIDNEIKDDSISYEYYQKYNYIQELYKNQVRIDKEIEELSLEINNIPTMPKNVDRWISSFESKFKISDLDRLNKINKKYKSLMEERKINGSKIKLFAIDNIMDQIKEITQK